MAAGTADVRDNLGLGWTPLVGQDWATIKWDCCAAPNDTKTGWSEILFSFDSSTTGLPWKSSPACDSLCPIRSAFVVEPELLSQSPLIKAM